MAFQNTLNPQAGQTPAANTNAVWTGAAPTDGTRWSLDSIIYSYTAAPTAATLIISWGSFSETYYIVGGGVGVLPFGPTPKQFPANTAVTVTLLAGGAGISGSVYPNGRTKE